MVAFGAGGVGAIVGLVIGVSLSVYVAFLDARKRSAEIRVRAKYRGSLVVVPTVFAGLGALVGLGIVRLL
ncbi:MAG: hypothetical protein ACLPVY_24145 [Acidimicrobiia bacterium]